MEHRIEKWSYWVYFIGQNLIYWLVTNYLMIYYTDYLFIPPLAVSILMLVSKVWDAVNDPLFGMIVDKAKFRSGKFIPWIRWGTILLPAATLFLFILTPEEPLSARILLASLGYLIWDLLYTISDVPIYALSTVITQDVEERSKIISYARLTASFGGVVVSLVVAPLIQRNGFLVPTVLVCVAAYLTMLPICKFAKERYRTESTQTKGLGVKETLAYFKENKYLMIIFLAICIQGIFNINLSTYIAKYCLGSLDYIAVTSMVTIVPGALVFIVVPIMLKFIDKIVLYRLALLVNIVLGVVAYFVGYRSIVPYMVIVAIRAFVSSIPSLLMFTFAPDCVEYGHYITGHRKEGINFSLQTFTSKFTAAISTAVGGFVLVLMHYDGSLKVQPESVPEQFWNYATWVPVLGSLISLPLFYRYKLRDKEVQIMADCNSGKITREEAEKLLGKDRR